MCIKKELLVIGLWMAAGLAQAATPQDFLKTYEAQSGKASIARGEQFFNAKHGKDWIVPLVMNPLQITIPNILSLVR